MTTPLDFATSAQALVTAIRDDFIDPADAIRTLSTLYTFVPDDPTSSSAIGVAMATMQSAAGDLFRRASVVALARACAAYQPASADDAAAIRTIVCDALDAEITIAGNQGEDATFNALRAVRSAVIKDLTTRGAGLASIETVSTNLPVPAPVLAHRLYQDPSRADELVAQANPVHPAFMPTRFKALSK
jgi:prophage DNA circulation protein